MEALGYILKRNLDTLADMGIHVSEIRSLGGGSKSPIWNQIKADINHVELMTTHSKEAASLGAAILAGKATGVFEDVDSAVQGMVTMKKRYVPNPETSQAYHEGYEMYKKLFLDLSECFSESK